jgi:hypothetical protein
MQKLQKVTSAKHGSSSIITFQLKRKTLFQNSTNIIMQVMVSTELNNNNNNNDNCQQLQRLLLDLLKYELKFYSAE